MTRGAIILFDIDGTLIRTGGVGRVAMRAALTQVVGDVSGLEAIKSFGGMTDKMIIRQALVGVGRAYDEALFTSIMVIYLDVLARGLEHAENYRVMPGVHALLDTMVQSDHALGLGTGNIEAGARLKLKDLSTCFSFGGFGSDAEDRTTLVSIGFERGKKRAPDLVRKIVIGDTPRDIEAARANQAEVIAVATGDYKKRDLTNADLAVDTLEDPRVLAFLEPA